MERLLKRVAGVEVGYGGAKKNEPEREECDIEH
jgi:hypothetical protein